MVSYSRPRSVKHEPLTLIPPEFETPLPNLRPAVFPPVLKEPPGPQLDLYDLDEHFASEKAKLAQLTNKCTDEDLDLRCHRYIKDALLPRILCFKTYPFERKREGP